MMLLQLLLKGMKTLLIIITKSFINHSFMFNHMTWLSLFTCSPYLHCNPFFVTVYTPPPFCNSPSRLFICPTNPTVVSLHAHYGWPSLLRRALLASLQTYTPPIFLYLFHWLNISPTCILVSPMHRTRRLLEHKSTPIWIFLSECWWRRCWCWEVSLQINTRHKS